MTGETMKYMMMFWVDESGEVTPDEDAAMMIAVKSWVDEMTARGVMVHGGALRSAGRGGGQQVLEVVQDEQDLPLAQLADQVVHQGPVPGVLQPEALRDRGRHQPRVADRRQRHEEDAVRVIAGHLGGQRDAEPGLAAAARPGQRDQAAGGQQPSGPRQLMFPADEAGQRSGQATA